MNDIQLADQPVMELGLINHSLLPVEIPLMPQGGGYIDNPLGGSLTVSVGPMVPIQFPSPKDEEDGLRGPMGQTGPRGPRGLKGDGKSAYEIWLDAGNVGTIYDFLRSLGFGFDLATLMEMLRGPLEDMLGQNLTETDAKLLAMQMLLDAQVHAMEQAIHNANVTYAQGIAAEALARADAIIEAFGLTEAAIVAESETRQTEDESYARATNLLLAQLDGTMRALVLSESQARVAADSVAANRIDAVNARLNTGDVATSMHELNVKITTANDNITIVSNNISLVQADLASAVSTLTASYDSITGKYNAAHTVTLSVDGHVSGTRSENNGSTSRFSILATVFQVISSASTGLEWRDGYLRAYSGAIQLIFGINFGASRNLCFWYGPNVGVAAASKSNATIWFDNAGSAYFGGTLSSGILKNGATTTSTQTIGLELTVGPFSTNGNQRSVMFSFSRVDSWYYSMYGNPGFVSGAGNNQTIVTVYRKLSGGAETVWRTFTINGSQDILNEIDGPDSLTNYWGYSETFTETAPSNQTVTYRAVITGHTEQSFSHRSGSGPTSRNLTQAITILSTEE